MRLCTLALSLVIAATAGLAAQQPAPEERTAKARERLQEIQARLKLSPEQTEKLKPILQQEAQEIKAIRDKQGSGSSRSAKMGMAREMRSVRDKYDDQIKAILTKDQQEEWAKIKAERRERLKQQRGK